MVYRTLKTQRKGVVLIPEYPPANKCKLITKRDGLSVSEWKEALKLIGQIANVQAVPGSSQDGNQCRHCTEYETISHVLVNCHNELLLRNTRHYAVRELIPQ